MIRRFAVVTCLALLGVLGLSSPASAVFHQLKIREVHRANTAANSYVMLQMYADGENQLNGHHLRLSDATGMIIGDYDIGSMGSGSNPTFAQSQRTVLIGGSGVAGRDYTYDGFGFNAGGLLCYNTNGAAPYGGIDCVSWGGFTPGAETASSPAGTPAATLGTDQSLVRSISPGCPTLLEAPDDTDNSAADFTIAPPIGRSNAATPTETPCVPGTSTSAQCAGKTATVVGTNASETLTGTAVADVITGLGGKDVIKGLAGNDVICGGAGKDRLLGGKGNDLLRGEAGRDTLKGGPGKDKLKGGPGKDVQIQ